MTIFAQKLLIVKLTLGFSPCPNDTFIFDALVNHKIDTEGLSFDVVMEDVENLNKRAIANDLDVSKISYAVLPLVLHQYIVLPSGGALGKGVGPLLISKKEMRNEKFEMRNEKVAIPGINTTANFLFSFAFPNAQNKIFMQYDEIEDFVLKGSSQVSPFGGDPMAIGIEGADLGVIIHENRFTYEKRGLHKITDLGEFWETKTGFPIPLGGIVVKRNFEAGLQNKINRLIQKSLQYAFEQYPVLPSFVKDHAREMDENVMRRHIELYVNDYSLDIGKEGKQAVFQLLNVYQITHRDFILPDLTVFSSFKQ